MLQMKSEQVKLALPLEDVTGKMMMSVQLPTSFPSIGNGEQHVKGCHSKQLPHNMAGASGTKVLCKHCGELFSSPTGDTLMTCSSE